MSINSLKKISNNINKIVDSNGNVKYEIDCNKVIVCEHLYETAFITPKSTLILNFKECCKFNKKT